MVWDHTQTSRRRRGTVEVLWKTQDEDRLTGDHSGCYSDGLDEVPPVPVERSSEEGTVNDPVTTEDPTYQVHN